MEILCFYSTKVYFYRFGEQQIFQLDSNVVLPPDELKVDKEMKETVIEISTFLW